MSRVGSVGGGGSGTGVPAAWETPPLFSTAPGELTAGGSLQEAALLALALLFTKDGGRAGVTPSQICTGALAP